MGNGMKMVTTEIIVCLMVCFGCTVPGYCQDDLGGYSKEVVVRMPWGSDSGEIGDVQRPTQSSYGFQGPHLFTADREGHIYVLDKVNGRMTIFDQSGAVQREFPLAMEGSSYFGIEVDEATDLLYLINQGKRAFDVYEPSGRLIRSIRYEMRMSSEFEVENGIINMSGRMLAADDEAVYESEGPQGEDVYFGHTWDDPPAGRYQYEEGKYSKTLFLQQRDRDSISSNGAFQVVRSDGTTQELNVVEMFPEYSARFFGETSEKEAIFEAFPVSGPSEARYVLKYNEDLELVSMINDPDFKPSIPIELVNDEIIYTFTRETEGVVLRKWVME